MTVRKLTFVLLLVAAYIGINAQTPGEVTTSGGGTYRSFTPKDQFELGIHLGVPFVAGDLTGKPGFGGGLHLRKSIDHIFSIRANTMFAKTKSEGNSSSDTRKSDITWIGGGAQIVAALNNIRFDKPYRKVLLQGFGGIGVSNFKVKYENILIADGTSGPTSGDFTETAPYVDFGGSLGFRVSPKFNIALEYTVTSVFGKQADRLDAEANVGNNQTTYRDNLHYPSVRLNFNLGGKSKDGMAKVEPLYWANPLSGVTEAITALEARPIYDPTDTDGDGIIDAIDDEDNSPAGARVDSKGVTLDSDGDKVPDYKDKEPYSPPGYAVNMDGVAEVPKYTTEKQVNDIVDAKLANFKLPTQPGLSNWFLPMVYFGDNNYTIRYSEYEKIYQVASVMKQNPDIKVVVIGNTDSRGSEKYNNVLSYNRAKSAIEFLVSQHGIARERLILNWVGEGSLLIPVTGSNVSNRRVEFMVAKDQTEMPRPEGREAGKGTFKGNKDAGY